MEYINPYIMISGVLWFASIMMLNGRILEAPRSPQRLISLQRFFGYRNHIKAASNSMKKRRLKWLYGLLVFFTANFFIQIVLHLIILELF